MCVCIGCVCRLDECFVRPGRPPKVQVGPPKHDALQTARLCSPGLDGVCLKLSVLYCCMYWCFVHPTQAALSVRCLWYMWGRCLMYGTLSTNTDLHSYTQHSSFGLSLTPHFVSCSSSQLRRRGAIAASSASGREREAHTTSTPCVRSMSAVHMY